MDVIWHQAAAPDFHFTGRVPFGHEFKINLKINLLGESLLTPVATLGDVVRHPWNHRTWKSGQAENLELVWHANED